MKTVVAITLEVDGSPGTAREVTAQAFRRALESPATKVTTVVAATRTDWDSAPAGLAEAARRYRRVRDWGFAPNADSGVTAVVFRGQALDTFVDRDLELNPPPEEVVQAPEPAQPSKTVLVLEVTVAGDPRSALDAVVRILGDGTLQERVSKATSVKAAHVSTALIADAAPCSPHLVLRDALRYRRLRGWGQVSPSQPSVMLRDQDLDALVDRDLEIRSTSGGVATPGDARG